MTMTNKLQPTEIIAMLKAGNELSAIDVQPHPNIPQPGLMHASITDRKTKKTLGHIGMGTMRRMVDDGTLVEAYRDAGTGVNMVVFTLG
jgi:hypothetical protein